MTQSVPPHFGGIGRSAESLTCIEHNLARSLEGKKERKVLLEAGRFYGLHKEYSTCDSEKSIFRVVCLWKNCGRETSSPKKYDATGNCF